MTALQTTCFTLETRFRQLENATAFENWDCEFGVPVPADAWRRVRRIVSQARRSLPTSPVPFITASGDGAVHLVWTTDAGDRGQLEIAPDGYWWTLIPREGQDRVENWSDVAQLTGRLMQLFA